MYHVTVIAFFGNQREHFSNERPLNLNTSDEQISVQWRTIVAVDMTPNSLNAEKLEELLDFSISLGREAGKLILEGSDVIQRSAADAVGEKKNSVDLITQYDKAVEDLVRRRTSSAYPDFGL